MINKSGKKSLLSAAIEAYEIKEEGSHPFLVQDSWQMVKLNYSKENSVLKIGTFTRHKNTDKGVALLQGTAILLIMDKVGNLQMETLKKGVTYNIPKRTWFSFILEKESELILVEHSNAHLNDTEVHQLDKKQLSQARELFNSTKIKL